MQKHEEERIRIECMPFCYSMHIRFHDRLLNIFSKSLIRNMKFITIVTLIAVVFICAGTSFAHEHHHSPSDTNISRTTVRPSDSAMISETHEQMATLTQWFSLGALIAKILSLTIFNRRWWIEAIATVLLVLCAATVSVAGHHGAVLVHMNGIGPMGNHLESEEHMTPMPNHSITH